MRTMSGPGCTMMHTSALCMTAHICINRETACLLQLHRSVALHKNALHVHASCARATLQIGCLQVGTSAGQ